MSKTPYLVRRNNIYYFRFRIPEKYQAFFQAREIVQSLKTEVRTEAVPLVFKLASEVAATLHDLKSGKSDIEIHPFNVSNTAFKTHQVIFHSSSPKLSTVVDDFLKRYDTENKSMLVKLTATLPILIELVSRP